MELTVASSSRKNARPAGSDVRAYLAALRPDVRAAVRKLREAIRSAAPGAVESITYGIPTFKLDGQRLVYCAGWTNHTSMYPLTAGMKRALAGDLDEYKTSKGTIRFPLNKQPSSALVKRAVKARVAEVREKGKA